ncbi:hypothetical protein RRG08_019376 [Elysia crispata]|uniref:Uncharacterized protein n=1 Tax=Elysia crispata TaxID=231223 RepID=A0AAE0XT47_9GAST|nr:hypothetical protein RRG08_019376 [Elysia crispata]
MVMSRTSNFRPVHFRFDRSTGPRVSAAQFSLNPLNTPTIIRHQDVQQFSYKYYRDPLTFDIRPWCKEVLDLNSPGPTRGPSISDHVVDSLVETYEAVQCGEQLFEDVGDRGGRGDLQSLIMW